MPFSEVIGQKSAVRLLRRSLLDERLAHAYLFSGPEGVGKRFVAVRLAQALNCEREDNDGCGECSACRRVAGGQYPGLIWVRPGGRARVIGIDAIRELCRRASLSPLEGRKKVNVIVDAERMTEEAGNAFLKTLEEPSPTTVFLLLTREPSQVLSTVHSRCLELRFGLLTREEISGALQDLDFAPERALSVASLSGGSLGRALSLAGGGLESGREQVWDWLGEVEGGPPGSFFPVAEEIAGELNELRRAGRKEKEQDTVPSRGETHSDL